MAVKPQGTSEKLERFSSWATATTGSTLGLVSQS
jgi:hypothetical protein